MKNKLVQQLMLGLLIFCVILGAGYRSIVLRTDYKVNNGFEAYVNIASRFNYTLGAFDFNEYRSAQNKPEKYVYRTVSAEPNTPSNIRNETGWAFILSMLFREGERGISNLALTVSRWQVMSELFTIIVLFWAGWKISGGPGAFFASFLYAVFKMPMVMMSGISHYYWPLPFSVLSVFFWTIVYQPERDNENTGRKYLSFFFYGLLVGLATTVRLYFVYLPFFMVPYVCLREKSFRKGVFLFSLILLGQAVFLAPQAVITRKYFHCWSMSTRGTWHNVIQGLGAYENPWGIKDTGDFTCLDWVKSHGGPDFHKSMAKYDRFCKEKAFQLFKERPDIFIRNAFMNIKTGLSTSPHDFQFFSITGRSDPSAPKGWMFFKEVFPWLLLSAMTLLFIFSRECFWPMLAVFLQGLYLILVVTLIFPPYMPWMAGYIPVFILLLGVSIAVPVKFLLAAIEAGMKCLTGEKVS